MTNPSKISDNNTAKETSKKFGKNIAKFAAAGALSLALLVAPGCKPAATNDIPQEQAYEEPEAAELPNSQEIETAQQALSEIFGKVSGYTPEIAGGAGTTDEQAENIRNLRPALQSAREQLASAKAQIESDEKNANYDMAAYNELDKLVKAAEGWNPLAQYNTALYSADGQWHGDVAKDDPKFISQLVSAPDLSKPQKYWDFQHNKPADLFADPNGNGDVYSLNTPEGVEIKVSKYQPARIYDGFGALGKDTTSKQIEGTGTVIDLGKKEITEGEVDASNPHIEMYCFDEPDISPKLFTASIDTTPQFLMQGYYYTRNDLYKEFWGESIDGLHENATWGERPKLGFDHAGEKVVVFTAKENNNRQIDPQQYPTLAPGAEASFGGQTFHQFLTDNKSVFTTHTFVSGGELQGIIPNLNDPAVRKLLKDYSTSTHLSTVKIEDTTISLNQLLIK